MCENPGVISKTATQKLEHRLLIESQRGANELKVDDNYAYLKGKAIQRRLWVQQSFEMGLPADMYLDIVTRASDEQGEHVVRQDNQDYLVETNGIITSKYGLHREIKSVTPYQR